MDLNKLSRNYEKEPLKLGEKPPYEDLKYLYLELNWSREEIAKLIGKSDAQTKKYLSAYKFKKTQKQKAEIRKRTMLSKYGVENISQLPEIKDKKEQKALEKYGVKNVFQAEEIKNKIRNTFIKKYNCNNPMQIPEVRNKRMKSEHYEYKMSIQTSGIYKEQQENDFTEQNYIETLKHQIELQNNKILELQKKLNEKSAHEKAKETCMKKYGVDHPMKSKSVQEKTKQTNLEKYGCENPMKNEEIKEKAKRTNLERYGVNYACTAETIRKKTIETNIKRYGAECPMKSEIVKNKIKKINLEKYGCENISQKHYSPEVMNILSSRENLKSYLETADKWTTRTLADSLGISISASLKTLKKYDLMNYIEIYSSSYEIELQQMFPFMHKTRSAIAPYEIDLYSEEHKFGIEFNGNYWHSEIKLPQEYHQKKSLHAEKKGIFLYHIWEYEWQDPILREKIISQIKNLLGENEKRIFARKCEVRNISYSESKEFLSENHIQNSSSDSVRLGLYYENELVSVMTFGKPRFNKKYQYELIRFCNKMNCTVIGGASKLFNHFIKEHKPESILSYSHISKGSGKLYEKLGFILESTTGPDYVWCNGEEAIPRYKCQKHKLLKQGFEGSNEREIMENLGFWRIFGCGNKVWTWSK